MFLDALFCERYTLYVSFAKNVCRVFRNGFVKQLMIIQMAN